MSHRCRSLLATVAVLILTGIALAVILWQPRSRPDFTAEQARLIRPGMTREEAVSLIGSPPGNYLTGSVHVNPDAHPTCVESIEPGQDLGDGRWIGATGYIVMTLKDDGTVEEAHFAPLRPCQAWSLWGWLKQRVGL